MNVNIMKEVHDWEAGKLKKLLGSCSKGEVCFLALIIQPRTCPLTEYSLPELLDDERIPLYQASLISYRH